MAELIFCITLALAVALFIIADWRVSARGVDVYVEKRDWWIGYYRSDTYHYVCPLPCLVIRWLRRVEPAPNFEPDVVRYFIPHARVTYAVLDESHEMQTTDLSKYVVSFDVANPNPNVVALMFDLEASRT